MSRLFAEICVFPLVKAGIVRTVPRDANSSIKNPLSARMQSSNATFSYKLVCSVISLSEVVLSEPADKKLTAPNGVM